MEIAIRFSELNNLDKIEDILREENGSIVSDPKFYKGAYDVLVEAPEQAFRRLSAMGITVLTASSNAGFPNETADVKRRASSAGFVGDNIRKQEFLHKPPLDANDPEFLHQPPLDANDSDFGESFGDAAQRGI